VGEHHAEYVGFNAGVKIPCPGRGDPGVELRDAVDRAFPGEPGWTDHVGPQAIEVASAVLCFAVSIATGQSRWRRLGLMIMKWTLVAGLAFFGVLILERLALLL
jgi:hypothetical protein